MFSSGLNSGRNNNYKFAYGFVVIILFGCYIISPIISFYMSLLLIALVKVESPLERFPFCFIIILSATSIYASRIIGFAVGDDFYYVYMPVYNLIKNGNGIFGGYYSSGYEFLLPVVFKIITLFDFGFSENELLFIISFFISTLYYIWLEKYLVNDFDSEKKSLVISSAFMFFNFFLTGYMVRQALSTIFILFALSVLGRKKYLAGIIFSLLAIFTHLSALPILVIFYCYLYSPIIIKNIILGIIITASLSFSVIKNFVLSSGLLGVATYKFDFYNKELDTTVDNGYVVHMIVLLILSFFTVEERYKKYKMLIIYGAISYFFLMPIPLAADRIMMPLTSFMLGVMVFIVSGKYSKLLAFSFIPYSIVRFLRIGPFYDGVGNTSYYLWHSYSWFGGVFNNIHFW